ncbi:HAD hydrolase-like protein, partial [Anaerosolibacter sp.]|uniref:HAD hydrolase-like protein n=1 Tax=Anaerosolibacter sp. TaxID=1872527 RepID=UPI0039EEB806
VYNSTIRKGLQIEKEELFTPVTAVKLFIEKNKNKTFYPLVHDDVLVDLEGINRNDECPDYVIIGDFCDKVSYEEINKVFRMIKKGSEIIALSKTLWYIDVDGYSINSGSFVKMFEIACNKEAILMGKPSEEYFKMGLNRTNSSPETTIVVGDDINTDILGAKKVNAIAILVKTGVYSEAAIEKAEYKPDYIIENVNGLPEILGL